MSRRSNPAFQTPLAATWLALAAVFGCGPQAATDREAPRGQGARDEAIAVAVTLPPQAWLAERIGGARVATTVLLPPGRSHHVFEPEPREILALRDARLYLSIDHSDLPFEQTLLDALPAAPRPEIVSWSAAAESATGVAPGPHYWLDPEAMIAAAEATASALAAFDSDRTREYHQNLVSVIREIETVADELEERLAPLRGTSVLVYHPAWGELLARHGIIEESIEHEGKPPSPRRLAEQIESAQQRGVTTVFSQPGLPQDAVETLAAEIGARVVELDPLARDWADNLRAAGRALAEGATSADAPEIR